MSEKEDQEKKGKELFSITTDNIWKLTTVVLAIVVVAFIVRGWGSNERGSDDVAPQDDDYPTETGNNGGIDPVEVTLTDADYVKGDKDAPVTIVEYSDFQCPYCQRFYLQTLPSIQENYIDTGKVKLIYRHFPLSFHQNAGIAAEAAECAGEQDEAMFWAMHDIMFEKGSGDGSGLARDDLIGYATTLGVDVGEFTTCIDENRYANKIQSDMASGVAAGVSGTPGFLVNGELVVGAQPYSVFQAAIEAALAE